jgi:hypothetical protein
MNYEAVLDLTVTQIAALLTKESLPPGLVDPELYQRIMRS